jgi:predicted amidohydrolase YtcJ
MTGQIERILINGHIRTLHSGLPSAEALAIGGGRVLALGSSDEMRRLAGSSAAIDDLGGAHVLPGFTDSHVHWSGTAQALYSVDLSTAATRDEAVARIAARVASTPRGEWVLGAGWSHAAWEGDQRFPTASDLDVVSPDHPVMMRARSGHALWANSAAMRLCGVDADTLDPPGGGLLRDEAGMPTGIFLEWTAMELINRHVPRDTTDRLIEKMRAAQAHAHRLGLTGIHDFDWRDSMIALQRMRMQGSLSLRVVKQINLEYLDSLLDLGMQHGFGDAWFRFGWLKIFIDGALGPRTASMIEPYDGEPENIGIVVVEKEQALQAVRRASAAGFPSTVHAIGDRAVRDILDVFQQVRTEEAASGIPRDHRRHRIEHVQLIHPDDVGRLAELDVIASTQPIHATSDMVFADKYWGARCAYAYNPRLQLDRGVLVLFGSDSPVDSLSPIAGIHAAVTRRRADGAPGIDGWYPAARVTIDEAVRGYTVNPARAAGIAHRAGQIAPGYDADLVVLDRDLYTSDPHTLLDTQVMGTMTDGQWQHRNF